MVGGCSTWWKDKSGLIDSWCYAYQTQASRKCTCEYWILFRYNAIIKPLKPRLSKFKTMGIAALIWSLGEQKFYNQDLARCLFLKSYSIQGALFKNCTWPLHNFSELNFAFLLCEFSSTCLGLTFGVPMLMFFTTKVDNKDPERRWKMYNCQVFLEIDKNDIFSDVI